MRSLERHRDAGAYALGLLDAADAFRFEDHLGRCPRCTAAVTGFRPTARQLLLYRRATPQGVDPVTRPGPRLLERLAAEVARRRKAGRRRALYGLGAAVVLAVGGPAGTVAAGHHTRAVVVTADGAGGGLRAEVRAAPARWGSEVRLRLRDTAGPYTCRLVAVGRDGSRQTVAGWRVPAHGTRPLGATGATALQPAQIARFEVRTADGRRLLTLDPR
ncbi:zf-HC2 domain-containing protein [Streptomyces thermodiastaticus]|uniref:zf-HC2 domain-containing protein n=1 Tax=Streptomyces thermodiastaticus TaxID=44061 RepID=UPI0016731B88|nr:zf-HC2 domain-containing protein [Streptomyces thermodiastaticus]MCE7551991.1 zf-HC2 domain-containing protein [Streptomyces thermodiastaticus]GHF78801.1 membrane protein [Streptomyces thermodiastaticus]